MSIQSLYNEGGLDRGLRILLGAFVISLVFWGPSSAWGWLGVVPLVTGLVGWCPAYSIFGIRTCKVR
ncbi:DUF2892 domain-containing protein [Acidithiobacillus sp. IBUN Pt1247-S3]|uniref:YgaP family membrane protein n=1 Tax=Acidithiobacillus sp. IBUN Pt1247-S3 TaxID=3166642 RepID=UPI0034E41A52